MNVDAEQEETIAIRELPEERQGGSGPRAAFEGDTKETQKNI
jgi:hypothetical protein